LKVRILLGEVYDEVVDGSDGAADPFGGVGGSLAHSAGKENPRTRRANAGYEVRLEVPAFSVGQLSNEQGRFRGPSFGASH
jgi:hypothetical protein